MSRIPQLGEASTGLSEKGKHGLILRDWCAFNHEEVDLRRFREQQDDHTFGAATSVRKNIIKIVGGSSPVAAQNSDHLKV